MIQPPLVSCIMPTYNRRRFIPQAVGCFNRQDYPNLELIVIDDGTDPIADLLPADPRIVYVRKQQRMTIGAKRNLACELARGEFVVHWDDDDWYAPARVRRQVVALQETGADLCASGAMYYRDVSGRAAYLIDARRMCSSHGPVAHGATFAYRRGVWANNRFPDWQTGEDTHFSCRMAEHRILDIHDATLFISSIHSANTVIPTPFSPIPAELRMNETELRRAEGMIFWSRVSIEEINLVASGRSPRAWPAKPIRFFSRRGCQICRFHKFHGAKDGDPEARAAYLGHRPLSTMTMADFA